MKKARIEAGLKQLDLAKKASMPQSTIAKYENHHIEPPDDKLELLAKILNMDINDLRDSDPLPPRGNDTADEGRATLTLHSRMAEAMEKSGTTFDALSVATTIPVSELKDYCSGKKIPILPHIVLIASALGISKILLAFGRN